MSKPPAERIDLTYTDNPCILLVAENARCRADATAAVRAIDGRVVGEARFDNVMALLSERVNVDSIIIETADANDDASDVLFEIDVAARERDIDIVVSMNDSQVDFVAARIFGSHAQLLCAPSVTERVAALAARSRARPSLNDITRDDESRIRNLNAEISRFAETLMRLSRDTSATAEGETPLRFGADPIVPAAAIDVAGGDVRNLIRARRMRSGFFPGDLFADPAWDMLLDLFAAEIEHRRVSVSSLCIAAAVPGTTALRWIGTMVDAGLFERQPDQRDRRRAYIGLSARARSGMQGYFTATHRAGLSPA